MRRIKSKQHVTVDSDKKSKKQLKIKDFMNWIGLGLEPVPRQPHFKSEDELWDHDDTRK